MTQEIWYSLDIKEQLSNIHGEVERMIRARNNYKSGRSKEDHAKSYIEKISHLISMTCSDPKNIKREVELRDEEKEIDRWFAEEVDDNYILRYWEQYTRAIS